VFGDPATFLLRVLFLVPALLLGFVLHEFAHAAVALSQGDPTPKNQGRLSLDPRRHLDPVGVLMVLFVGIGYARPVQINPSRLRTEFSRLLVALAGRRRQPRHRHRGVGGAEADRREPGGPGFP